MKQFLILVYLGPTLTINRPRNTCKLENFLSNELKHYLLTEPLIDLYKSIVTFLKQKQIQSVHFKLENNARQKSQLDSYRDDINSFSDEDEQSEDYAEILKLRHINLTK